MREGHEQRSYDWLIKIFQDEASEEIRTALTRSFPGINIMKTISIIDYIIKCTDYFGDIDEREKLLYQLDLEEEVVDKIRFLGALAIFFDIGIMAILPNPILALEGLIAEHLKDQSLHRGSNLFCSAYDWIVTWLYQIELFAQYASTLIRKGGFIPDLTNPRFNRVTTVRNPFQTLQSDLREHPFCRAFMRNLRYRKVLLDGILRDKQGDKNTYITWGELYTYVQSFTHTLRQKPQETG